MVEFGDRGHGDLGEPKAVGVQIFDTGVWGSHFLGMRDPATRFIYGPNSRKAPRGTLHLCGEPVFRATCTAVIYGRAYARELSPGARPKIH